mgnify:CR=1 FL=1
MPYSCRCHMEQHVSGQRMTAALLARLAKCLKTSATDLIG